MPARPSAPLRSFLLPRYWGLGGLLLFALAVPAGADPSGAFHGRVLQREGDGPVAGATVILEDRHGKPVAQTVTDADGRYTLPADTLGALGLKPGRRRGFFTQVARGTGEVLTAPVRLVQASASIVTGAVRAISPQSAVISAVVARATGSALPFEVLVASSAAGAAQGSARSQAVRTVLDEREGTETVRPGRWAPGDVRLTVRALSYQPLQGVAGAYWLEPDADGVDAWLETVRLAPAGARSVTSRVDAMAVLLTEVEASPAVVPAGGAVTLRVRLSTPAEPAVAVRVVAREARTRRVAELLPQGDGVYEGTLRLPASFRDDCATVTIAALRAAPLSDEGRDVLDQAARLDSLDPGKPYRFDPRTLASENRLEVRLTVAPRG